MKGGYLNTPANEQAVSILDKTVRGLYNMVKNQMVPVRWDPDALSCLWYICLLTMWKYKIKETCMIWVWQIRVTDWMKNPFWSDLSGNCADGGDYLK